MTSQDMNTWLDEIMLNEMGDAGWNGSLESKAYQKAKAQILAKTTEARIAERQEVALDNYTGKTFSDSTDYKGKWDKFVRNNEIAIKRLEQL